MADFETSTDSSSRKGLLWVIGALVIMGVLAFLIVNQKQKDKEKAASIQAAEQELDDDSKALKAERDKLDDFTKQVEELRAKIIAHDVKDGKAAVDQFNKLAADQRAQREKYLQMADQYNQKVAKVRQLAQE